MKVVIHWDEDYSAKVHLYEPDDDAPEFYMPTEIPDTLWADYVEAKQRFLSIKHFIVNHYGESEVNPDYHEQFSAWFQNLPKQVNEES